MNSEDKKRLRKFGTMIKSTAQSRGYSLTDAAHKCGISVMSIYRIANGESQPQLFTFVRLCRGLGLDVKVAFEDLLQ